MDSPPRNNTPVRHTSHRRDRCDTAGCIRSVARPVSKPRFPHNSCAERIHQSSDRCRPTNIPNRLDSRYRMPDSSYSAKRNRPALRCMGHRSICHRSGCQSRKHTPRRSRCDRPGKDLGSRIRQWDSTRPFPGRRFVPPDNTALLRSTPRYSKRHRRIAHRPHSRPVHRRSIQLGGRMRFHPSAARQDSSPASGPASDAERHWHRLGEPVRPPSFLAVPGEVLFQPPCMRRRPRGAWQQLRDRSVSQIGTRPRDWVSGVTSKGPAVKKPGVRTYYPPRIERDRVGRTRS